ncbi:iron transporter [Demequina sp. TTPB684]|nr:iron transporter [Demequina sp. TMPB413]MCB2414094.1 iron transporter [Demequina sp. TTPB684]UPU89195.1 iron transporter [Demequina sp. TMPB413]
MNDTTPPMNPASSEATDRQLDLARAQGDAYRAALDHMANDVAHDGGLQLKGDYLIAYAIEDAEGVYAMEDGELVWHNPDQTNAHVEVIVCDAADGRFVPGLTVTASLETPRGAVLGPYTQELVWHPMIYHYARNWTVPEDGEYTLRVHIEPAGFSRHDEINGRRFADAVDAEFTGVAIERGAEPVEPPR